MQAFTGKPHSLIKGGHSPRLQYQHSVCVRIALPRYAYLPGENATEHRSMQPAALPKYPAYPFKFLWIQKRLTRLLAIILTPVAWFQALLRERQEAESVATGCTTQLFLFSIA